MSFHGHGRLGHGDGWMSTRRSLWMDDDGHGLGWIVDVRHGVMDGHGQKLMALLIVALLH